MRVTAVLQALAAALLFGVTPTFAKALGLDRVPWVGAALLYGGAGLALFFVQLARSRSRQGKEAALVPGDGGLLAVIIAVGGVAAPAAMLYGLSRTSASTASLLLTLETIWTALLAVAFFGEHFEKRLWVATAIVLASSTWLGLGGAGGPGAAGVGQAHGTLWGAAAIALACLGWGLDNNCTQRLSARDPVRIVTVKGLGAALCASLIAFGTRSAWPNGWRLAGGLALGAVSYGTSLVLYVRALRGLGAARTAAFFATAPFVGALASVLVLGERPTLALGGAALGMAAGVGLLLRERHHHEHVHDLLEHEHAHVHDEHHRHAHAGGEGPEPHSHLHRHEALVHAHPHAPDLHHRHKH